VGQIRFQKPTTAQTQTLTATLWTPQTLKRQAMKLSILLFFSIPTVLTSCSGQQTSLTSNKSASTAVGDTVKDLGNNIMLVYQDKKNNYWFGSWETGLYCYDGKAILNFTTKSGLPHNRVEEIKEDKSGNIYVNTSQGISKFDGQTFTTLSITNSDNQWKLEPNDLWFRQGWDSGFVYRYDGNFLYKLQSPKNPNYSTPSAVYSIFKDSKGNVWFGTNPLGVYRYNGKSVDWITENDVTELHDGPANGVRSIIEDKDGYFWFNSAYRYDVYGKNNAQNNTFYTREKSIGNLDGNPDSDFWEYMSIARDNDNAL
jgi:ligand-binding sensor domain-containing protein